MSPLGASTWSTCEWNAIRDHDCESGLNGNAVRSQGCASDLEWNAGGERSGHIY
ncbi:hypothetical protein F442_17879 [Phytophthora nicotianae P10297]|uniref:Uncharacterized protein n=1 Tax=Phytophthora nicotianae P10297 TaxID=1317064 RepID=W2YHE3_PHYNI|nr:hypothetical protein F442_17879 [Phytophthora nicotianae P10297]